MSLKLSENALKVLERRYLMKDEQGEVIETPEGMFRRVAKTIALADKYYGKNEKEVSDLEEAFYRIMTELEFMPNSPCFIPSAPVLLAGGYSKPISEVKVDDEVVTHLGNIKRVTEVHRRFVKEKLLRICVRKLDRNTLGLTKDHPILAIKKNQIYCVKRENRVCTRNYTNCIDCPCFLKDRAGPQWIKAGELSIGDYVVVQPLSIHVKDRDILRVSEVLQDKLLQVEAGAARFAFAKATPTGGMGMWANGNYIKDEIKIDEKFLLLLGYFLAEGSAEPKRRRLRFAFGIHERHYIEETKSLIKDIFGLEAKEEIAPHRKAISITVHSAILANFFARLLGEGAHAKKMPEWMLYLPSYKQKWIIIGLFRGDGCHYYGRIRDRLILTLGNRKLVEQALWILYRLDYPFSFERFRSNDIKLKEEAYSISIAPMECPELIDSLGGKERRPRKYQRFYSKAGKQYIFPITSIEDFIYEGEVWNLEVEDDNSYIVNSVAVHNCLMNAGKELAQLSACFVLPIDDSMDSIFESLKATAMIHKSGGGTGFSFSRLRPKNAVVKTTGGIASGPVSFMKVYDAATEAVKQGGTRRGANMGILRVDHPDILEFITCKENNKQITNFNISVAITDDFMQKLEKGEDYDLVDPHTQKVVRRISTKEVFDLIVKQAHKNGEPGVIFIDRMNQYNPTPKLGRYESTNPCGEQVLLPYESCDLGSINLAVIHKKAGSRYEIDWNKLKEVTHLAVHFLDNLIDVNKFPLPQIEKATKLTRKIGLGVMGWASLLIRLNIPYNTDEAVALAEKVMSFILNEATKKSLELGKDKGTFSAFKGSIYDKKEGATRMRNATLTTIAPTGTISIIAGPSSSGIEPLFAISYYRNVMDNDKLVEVDPLFEEIAKEREFYSRELMEKIAEKSSIQDIEGIPEDVKRIFVTAHDISPEWHVRMQAAFQRYVHNATSKTVNFPNEATVEDVRKAYLLAYELGCKGITIYRDKSREEQVLNIGRPQEKTEQPSLEFKKGIAPRPRPEVIIGTTTKVATGCGNLYVTINVDEEGRPFELFTQMGKAGGCAASQLEAIGRLVSLAFRSGIEVKSIIDQLRNIRCPSPSWEKGQRIFSCADAIARVIERRLINGQEVKATVTTPVAMKHSNEDEPIVSELDDRGEIVGVCPDCGGTLRHEEGCIKCHACGFSKC